MGAGQDPEHRMEERFFDIAIDLLCFLDFEGRFLRLNPTWERTLGFSVDELRSRPFIEFVHPEDRARTLEQNRRVRSGEHGIGFENRYRHEDGSYRWLTWNAVADLERRVIYSVARDVTARKRAEEEREAALRRLQNALAEVKTLQDLLPICSYCRRIRGDEDYWHTVETYIERHTNTRFSHGICPSCYESEVEAQLRELEEGLSRPGPGGSTRGSAAGTP